MIKINFWESFKVYSKKIEENLMTIIESNNNDNINKLSRTEKMDGYRICVDILSNDYELLSFYKNFESSLKNFMLNNYLKILEEKKNNLIEFFSQVSNFYLGVKYLIKEYDFFFSNIDKEPIKQNMMGINKSNYYIFYNFKTIIIYHFKENYEKFEILIDNFRYKNLFPILKNNFLLLNLILNNNLLEDRSILMNLENQFENSLNKYYTLYLENSMNNLNDNYFSELKLFFENEINNFNFLKELETSLSNFYDKFLNCFQENIWNLITVNDNINNLLMNIFNDNKLDKLSDILFIINNIDNNYIFIFKILKNFINNKFNQIVDINNNQQKIKLIKESFEYCHKIALNYFNKNKNIFSIIYDSFETNIYKLNKKINFHEILLNDYKFTFDNLIKEPKTVDEFKKETFSLINLISFLQDKDIFFKKVTKILINYLINEENIENIKYLKLFFNELKEKLGDEFTKNIEVLIEQKLYQKNEDEKFDEFLKNSNIPKKCKEFSSFLINSDFWKVKETNIIKKTKNLNFIQGLYESYLKKNNIKMKKRLTWDYTIGIMELKYNFENNFYFLKSQPIFAIILLEFPKNNEILEENLKINLMGTDIEGFNKAINHLIDNQILKRLDKKLILIIENLILINKIPEFNFEKEIQKDTKNFEDIKIILDHFIVRKLKLLKRIEKNQLFEQSKSEINNITFNMEEFNISIEGLVKRDFIKYCENKPNI